MSDIWKQCEGQVVDNSFPLKQYLGGTDDSAVFLTQLDAPRPQSAAIKLIPADARGDLQISLWRRATQLAHPNLLRILNMGRCRLANKDLLYVVMEYAEENLAQILPERSLTAEETREVLEPVLEVLAYLHARGLVHSHIKPSNIFAIGNQVKLSSDCLFPVGESRKSSRQPNAYQAPEVGVSPLSPLTDVWSLGITLVEVLTQHAPAVPHEGYSDPTVPDSIPQPFLDVARRALCRDPKRRWNVAEIAARLNPAAMAAAAAAAASPLAVPLSPVPAVPAAKLQVPKGAQAAPPSAQAQAPQTPAPRKQAIVLPNYMIPVAASILIIAAIIALPKILGHRSESSAVASNASSTSAPQPKAATPRERREDASAAKPAVQPSAQNAVKTTSDKKAPPPNNAAVVAQRQPAAAPPPAPASLRTDNLPPANAPKTPPASPGHGEVLDQVMPDISDKARATIQGVVRVTVRVHVDPSGLVSGAELESPGPSQYFADQALKAARRWVFTSPEVDGHSVASEWLIRFHFATSGDKAYPEQATP